MSFLNNLFNNNVNIMTTEELLYEELEVFNKSDTRNWMITGDRYYKVENDILNRKIVRATEKGEIEDKSKANNKLAHGLVKNLIDEKIGYLLTKDYSLKSDDTSYVENIKEVLGKYFQYTLTKLGIEASNKGIGWLHVYIDELGNLKTIIIPSEQCIPLWKDNSHTELEGMIRYYLQTVYEGKQKKQVTKVEYYTEDNVSFYVIDGKKFIPDIEANEGGPISHYKKGDEDRSWGKVPFIAFKNNSLEYPDIRFIKSLIDNYDSSRSDIANFIEEVKNLIYVLKNYGGEDLAEFMRDLNYHRAIKVDDDGGVDTLNPTIDITATKEHFEQLKRDINEFGQGVNKDLDKFGSAPSGVALKFLYSGLDIKCNHLEVEFKMAFENLLYFIDVFLSETSKVNSNPGKSIEIIFNRDIAINETEAISNCGSSVGIISDDTIIANHPWVKDVEEEKKRLQKQKKEDEVTYPNFPNKGDLDEE